MPSSRMVPAVAVALLAGALQALRLRLPQLVVDYGATVSLLGTLLPAMALVSLVVSPFGAAVAGYLWGTDADVADEWPTFLGVVFAAAVAGFVAVLLVLSVVALLGGRDPASLVVESLAQLLYGLGLANVAFAGLAGGAIGTFRAGEPGNSNTATA